MRSEDLFHAIGNMDDRYIDDRLVVEIQKVKRLPLWSKLVAACACVTVLVLSVMSIWKQGETTKIVYPSENSLVSGEHSNADMYVGPYYLNYADLALFADTVVVVDVVDTFQGIWTKEEDVRLPYANVKVREVLKGNVRRGKTICVQDAAHIEEGKVYSFAGAPLIETGNRVLLFLSAPVEDRDTVNGTAYYRQALPWIGAFFYDRDECYHAAAEYGGGNHSVRFTQTSPKSLQEIQALMQNEYRSLSDDEFETIGGFAEIYSFFFDCKTDSIEAKGE